MAPLPALLAAVALPDGSNVSLPWLLLGVELGLDHTGRVFLLFSGLLWLVASLYAAGSLARDRNAGRYRVLFMLAMAGNLGLIVAQDMVTFYLGFTLMGLTAYGLIAHPASLRARRAGRRYLVWTITGELILFVAIVMLVQQNGGALAFSVLTSNPPAGFVVLLLIIGFGIKLALPGLHLWLPHAYAVTPAPAVAALSGAMIKAGLLGWLRFLPPGEAALTGWGQALIVAGVIGIFFGAIVGLLQHRPRLLLAYSSVSKMGVLTAGMGATLAWPAAAPLLIGALAIYAAHHALVKGALFLGLGLVERGGLRLWVLAGLAVLALALAGAPLTSGSLAKSVLTASLPQEAHHLLSVLAVSAFATTLLMARFLFLVWRLRSRAPSSYAAESTTAWLLLLALVVLFPLRFTDALQFSANVAPVSVGALLAALALLAARRVRGRVPILNSTVTEKRFALSSERAVRNLCQVVGGGIATMHSTVRKPWTRIQRILSRRPITSRRPVGNGDRWSLAGSLWLGIGGLLLTAFISAA